MPTKSKPRRQPSPVRRKSVATPRKVRASFLRRDKWWVAWTDDVPGALTQGKSLDEARENLKDAIRMMLEPADFGDLINAKTELVEETLHL